jgi:hypothetical protein
VALLQPPTPHHTSPHLTTPYPSQPIAVDIAPYKVQSTLQVHQLTAVGITLAPADLPTAAAGLALLPTNCTRQKPCAVEGSNAAATAAVAAQPTSLRSVAAAAAAAVETYLQLRPRSRPREGLQQLCVQLHCVCGTKQA